MIHRQLPDVYARLVRPLVVIPKLERRPRRPKVLLQRLHLAVDPRLQPPLLESDVVRERGA